jgi:5-methylcytosine-specific restriction enzyme subunit McrC
LKGKINFARNLSLNLTHLERFFTEHHVYDYSHALNGILKMALLAVVQGSVHPMLKNRIRVLLLHFDSVEEYLPNEDFYDHLKYDRKSIGYKDAITLARMILNNYAPDMSGGDENIVAVLFDMNKLFEEYVYRILLKESKQIGSQRVEIHYHRSSAFWGKSTLHPDILAIVDYAGEKRNYIIDTKWKIVSSSKPADEDLKQIFVYNRYFSSMHGVLLYPSTGQRNEGVKQFAAIPNQEGSTGGCETFFANLFDKSDHLDNRFAQDFISQILLSS